MSKVIVEMGVSLEGFVAGPNAGPHNALGDGGEVSWPDPQPFRAPVFVLTNRAREPWARQGGTAFTFVTDGIESALGQARAAAGHKGGQDRGRREHPPTVHQSRTDRRTADPPSPRVARRRSPVVRRDRSQARDAGERTGHRFPESYASRVPSRAGEVMREK